MKRGEIWTAAAGPDYAGKPRPVVIVQDDRFDATAPITVCPFTPDPTDAPLFRPAIALRPGNRLQAISRPIADKVTSVTRAKLGSRTGVLTQEEMRRLDRAPLVFLGLAG